jgi:Holliday junction DNA helicase RuvA
MIVGLVGKVVKKEPTLIHLNVSGVIYEVFVSVNCSSSITTTDIELSITQIIREDANVLFGFLDVSEKLMFDTVIKINGVGPKVAMAICSTFTPATFSNIISSSDVSALKRVPGIGPKSASRILVELSGVVLDTSGARGLDTGKNDAFLALESLGFKKDIITKVLSNINSSDTSTIVKEALKKLQK